MKLATDEADVLARIVGWTSADDRVRAALLTSTRANPRAALDVLSDYDVVLLVSDVASMTRDLSWADTFGVPLLRVRDVTREFGLPVQNDMLLYEDGTKIDYTLWPLELVARIAEEGALPEDFDGGYRVLLDKDGLTRGWPAPSHTAYIPAKPSAAEFQALFEEFWWVATYVAKNLWRGELLTARVLLDQELTYLVLLRLLVWRIEIDNGWAVQPGFFARGMQRHLDRATWEELLALWSGTGYDETWASLDRAIALFRRVAAGVARDLGYRYPDDLDRRMSGYLQQIRQMGVRGSVS